MDSNWTSASYVANKYYTGTIGTETNSNLYDVNNEFKGKIDGFDSEHQGEMTNPIDTNKRILTVSSISVTPEFKIIEGVLTRVDTMTFGMEATTVIYTKVDVTTNSDIIRKTTTNYYTIVDGSFTVTGDDSYSKSYKSGDSNKKEDYIAGNYTDDAVKNIINEYTKDMVDIASDYRSTALINGEVSSYYYEAHDEITQDLNTGKIVINTILNKYQVYTLTGTAESNKITYTLDDENENQISFKDFEGIVFAFSSTDILNMTDEELQAAADEIEVDIEEIRAMLTKMIDEAKNAIKGKGTLVGLYDFAISDGIGLKEEATGGFKIRIKMTEEMKKYNDFAIAYLKDDGSIEDLIKLTQDGEYLEGILPHLSTYVVIGNNVEETPTTNNPKTGDNIITYFIMFGLSIASIIVIKLYTKKNSK